MGRRKLNIISGVLFCSSLILFVGLAGAIDLDTIDFKRLVILSVVAVALMVLSFGISQREDA